MKTKVTKMFDIEFPLFAFTHCRDVVVAVSKAGGFGVYAAGGLTNEQFEIDLKWIDNEIGGRPYGVDLLIPNKSLAQDEEFDSEKLKAMIPKEYGDFRADILEKHGIDGSDFRSFEQDDERGMGLAKNTKEDGSKNIVDIALSHPISLIVNALGVPPFWLLELAKEKGIKVGAMIGSSKHAIKQAEAGVDLLIASGTEAGGHTGEVSTMVLIPEIFEAIKPYGDIPILAAGGIMNGQQMAAAMAMGAAGAWCGSVWLTTIESELPLVMKEKMIEANSSQTIRSNSRTGKYSRQLVSSWTEAWEAPDALEPLPMPLQTMVTDPPLIKAFKLAEGGHEGAKELATYWVGQGVGLLKHSISASDVVQEFKEGFIDGYERLHEFTQE
jgi:NAD(P)H-dependent flavin oxidoreductase YrpB (nitropropane dioxygenase family)